MGTLTGLAHPMLLLGPSIFVEVWSASILGDLAFVAGMVGTYYAARRTPGALAIPAALVMTWLTYAVAWAITGSALEFDDVGAGYAPVWVLQWGWFGVVVCGLWPWVQRTMEEKSETVQVVPLPPLVGEPPAS